MPIVEEYFHEDDPLTRHVETKGDDFDWRSPWRAQAREGLRERAMDHHTERSDRARTMDALYNAPIAPDYATWRANPNRYDIPDVDTIPSNVRRRRADRFLDQLQVAGAVTSVQDVDEDDRSLTKGSFLPSKRILKLNPSLEDDDDDYPQSARSFTVAHEGGHALDTAVGEARTREEGYPFDELGWSMVGTYHYDRLEGPAAKDMDADRDLAESFRTLSERARGRIPESDDDVDEDDELSVRWDNLMATYRGKVDEMFADATALAVLEPRAARREAPLAYDTIQREGFGWLEAELEDAPNEGSGNNSGDVGEFV